MKILGISDSSVCGGATLMEDGVVLASINEERLDRQKLSTGFPALAINKVLEMCHAKPEEIDRVFAADQHNYFNPKSEKWQGWLIDHASASKKLVSTISSYVSNFVGNSPTAQEAYYKLKRKLTEGRRDKVTSILKENFGLSCPVSFLDHHYCHAASAYFTAGFPDATVITLDGGGDGLCSRVYRVKQGQFELLHTLNSYHSIGNYYSYVTKLCGFTAHKHEGKITGLAAYGKPIYQDLIQRMISYDDGNIHNRGNAYFWSAVDKLKKALPHDFKREDLAASMQSVLESAATHYCDFWIRKSGIGHVALAGGVFANVRLNQRIHELESVQMLHIHPGMGDEGLSFGAAVSRGMNKNTQGEMLVSKKPMRDAYLGPDYSDDEISTVLEKQGLKFTPYPEVEKQIALLLKGGHVVARFNGRMEYGPRALGNRSLLYQPTDPSVNDWLNERLKRTEFMPFAPAVKMEMAKHCFHDIEQAEQAASFMTVTLECTDAMKESCKGVVHVDGSARPQFVTQEINPSYYKIIDEYQKLTGLPSIINTSFNVHDEPIVCSPEDAVNGFLSGGIDYLAIGPFIIKHPTGEAKA